MITEDTIQQVVTRIAETQHPVQVVLFGSCARGEQKEGSDLDLMVVKADVSDRIAETRDARRSVSPLRVPVDLILHSRNVVEQWKDVPGNLIYEVMREGRVVYDAAA